MKRELSGRPRLKGDNFTNFYLSDSDYNSTTRVWAYNDFVVQRINKLALVGKGRANGLGDQGSIPGRVIPKTQKCYLIPPCLTLNIIRYVSSVKWSNPGKGVAPFQHFGVVAIEKGALGLPSTTVDNLTFIWFQVTNDKILIKQS